MQRLNFFCIPTPFQRIREYYQLRWMARLSEGVPFMALHGYAVKVQWDPERGAVTVTIDLCTSNDYLYHRRAIYDIILDKEKLNLRVS